MTDRLTLHTALHTALRPASRPGSRPVALLAAALLALTLLPGCGGGESASRGFSEATSRTLVPADDALAAIYNRSCRSCHTVAATGSPLTGDREGWQSRMDKGMGVLLDNVINGYGGMPALGLCMDCDVDQFEALIRFMATGE